MTKKKRIRNAKPNKFSKVKVVRESLKALKLNRDRANQAEQDMKTSDEVPEGAMKIPKCQKTPLCPERTRGENPMTTEKRAPQQ